MLSLFSTEGRRNSKNSVFGADFDCANGSTWPMGVHQGRVAQQERCSRRATHMIVRPLMTMASCSMIQAARVRPARG
jgi:hypothetical protein